MPNEVTPPIEPVDGKLLLDTLAATVSRFIVLPKWAADTLALWILHTYAFELRDVSTYIGVESPEKRCGKTTLLSVLSELVHRPVVDVEFGLEQLAHAGFDRIGQLARNDDARSVRGCLARGDDAAAR